MCLYYNRSSSAIIVVGVYVDGLLVTASLQTPVKDFYVTMGTLSIKDLGEVRNILGMRVELNEGDGYTLDQQATIVALLEKHELVKANGVQILAGEDRDEAEASEMKYLVTEGLPGEPSIRNL